jgi:glutamyl/glutaminyl-tRNA synthetase
MNDVSVDSYLEKGYLKEALINFVALLGWHGADDRELYTMGELCSEFSLDRVNKAGAVFDLTKLDWMNGQYIRSLPLEYIAGLCRPHFVNAKLDTEDEDKYLKVINTARNYVNVINEITSLSEVYYKTQQASDAYLNSMKGPSTRALFEWYIHELSMLNEFGKENLTELVNRGMQELNIKGKLYFHPLRVALIYKGSGPDIPTIVGILGREETLKRLKFALDML